jgi:hypothetical protein
MNSPPSAIVAAPAKVAATEDCQTHSIPQKLPDGSTYVNEFDDELNLMVEEHRDHAPEQLRDKFHSVAGDRIEVAYLACLARVRFGKHCFHFDPEGRWAVVAPVFEWGHIVNLAACAVDDDTLRRRYRPGDFAVGLEDAVWEARFHPKQRLLVHYSVWSWLGCSCTGVLPIDWEKVGIFIKRERYGILYSSEGDGLKAQHALKNALALPAGFIRSDAT